MIYSGILFGKSCYYWSDQIGRFGLLGTQYQG